MYEVARAKEIKKIKKISHWLVFFSLDKARLKNTFGWYSPTPYTIRKKEITTLKLRNFSILFTSTDTTPDAFTAMPLTVMIL